jgi:hypothetical protein
LILLRKKFLRASYLKLRQVPEIKVTGGALNFGFANLPKPIKRFLKRFLSDEEFRGK